MDSVDVDVINSVADCVDTMGFIPDCVDAIDFAADFAAAFANISRMVGVPFAAFANFFETLACLRRDFDEVEEEDDANDNMLDENVDEDELDLVDEDELDCVNENVLDEVDTLDSTRSRIDGVNGVNGAGGTNG